MIHKFIAVFLSSMTFAHSWLESICRLHPSPLSVSGNVLGLPKGRLSRLSLPWNRCPMDMRKTSNLARLSVACGYCLSSAHVDASGIFTATIPTFFCCAVLLCSCIHLQVERHCRASFLDIMTMAVVTFNAMLPQLSLRVCRFVLLCLLHVLPFFCCAVFQLTASLFLTHVLGMRRG